MNTIIYPETFACPNHNGAAVIILPQQKNNLLNFYLKLLSLFLATLLFTFSSFSQGACPTSNCVSGDMTLTKVELVDANTLATLPNICPPNQATIS